MMCRDGVKYTKSQIFLLDFIFASILFVISIGIFFIYFSFSEPQEDLYEVVYRVSSLMSSTKINDLNNDYVRDLFIAREIRNIDNTLLQQISEFYVRGDLIKAQNLTREIAGIYILERIGYSISFEYEESINTINTVELDNSTIFPRDEARTLATIQRRIIGFDEGNNPYIHTYIFEVWRN